MADGASIIPIDGQELTKNDLKFPVSLQVLDKVCEFIATPMLMGLTYIGVAHKNHRQELDQAPWLSTARVIAPSAIISLDLPSQIKF